MGNSEEGKCIKTEKPSSPDQANRANQANVHVYPDWAAMQAYYGPGFSIPPYYNPAMAAGHAPHPYMWGPPQPMMPPYGPPYAAIYPHGGVYTHPAVAIAGTPSSVETPTKISGNTDQGLMKKLKGFDGLAMSIGNDNAGSAGRGAENVLSQSVDTEGSSDGSDGNTSGANQSRKRSCEGTPTTDREGKTEVEDNPVSKETAASNKMVSATPISAVGKFVGPTVSSGMTTTLELRNPSAVNAKAKSTSVPQPCGVLPPEAWLQDERDLKRERRKQSNRESARRSRLRKQAEAEELARKVDNLTAENVSLKSEINQLDESSEKLRVENATLKEKLKNAQLGQTEEVILNSIDIQRAIPRSTENLLSRVNNSSSNDITAEDENDYGENKPTSGAKLHQLLDNHRANAVAAS
ncbi:PREDICTED: common plant regulatory factor 1-like isoform X3 [Lupinus angustifolius]|uniref:common plant regulatory factor 1-like isoform X3 n=1 Tax=Lupinus angustifolius TaxID=3871 RepID=UPI00092F138F|nr:PREDICTED: common plant regulatory factor 1-like isoform X3 [Lupinus angustifolius]